MHLIIDGYNLIRQSPQLQLLDAMDLQSGREALLELVTHYRSRSNHQITVVFDGWQHGDLKGGRDRHQGILIIFSRRGERADEVIKRLHQERALWLLGSEIRLCRTIESFMDQFSIWSSYLHSSAEG
jgi:predicted RNA-binding protein with PIN domain